MQNHTIISRPVPRLHRSAVGVASLILLAIGLWVFVDPVAYAAGMGVAIPRDPSLLSDMRAQAGALLGFAGLLGFATLRPRHIAMAAPAGAIVFLTYGLSRLVAMSVDGMPVTSLVVAAAFELIVGVALVLVARRASSTAPRAHSA